MALGLRRKLVSGWVGLARAQGELWLAHVARRPGALPALLRLESIPFEASADPAEGFGRLRQKLDLGDKACCWVLQPGEYQIQQTDLPEVPVEEMREALRWRLKDMVDFPVEGAVLDYLPLPAGPGLGGRGPSAFAVMAAESTIAPLVRGGQDSHFPLLAIDVPELAQRNISALVEDDGRGLALVTFGPQGGLLTLTYGGELCALRRIDLTETQLTDPDPERKAQSFERVGLELQRTLDNFERLFSAISISRLLVAPASVAGELTSYLVDYLYVPVASLDLAGAIDCAALSRLPRLEGAALEAVGAALRGSETEGGD